MDPMQALRSAETALRLAITRVLGDSWALAAGAPEVKSLEKKRDEEKARRDGAVASQDLLDYTETYQLTHLIQKNWEVFKPVFQDSKRTFVYFGILLDVRNTVAHSRDLLKFEKDLLAGISGQIRNQVALFRSEQDESTRYYPLFERIVDSFGTVGENTLADPPSNRIDVGAELHFSGSAFGANGTPVTWKLQRTKRGKYVSTESMRIGTGDRLEYTYVISEEDVSEDLFIGVLLSNDSPYHRHGTSYDDVRFFRYKVNPPRIISGSLEANEDQPAIQSGFAEKPKESTWKKLLPKRL